MFGSNTKPKPLNPALGVVIWVAATLLTGPIGLIGWPIIWVLSERQIATQPAPKPRARPRPKRTTLPTPGAYYDESIPFENLPN